MFKALIISLITFFYSASSIASQIHIPENITVISINGKEQGFSFFNRQTTWPIKTGSNVLQLRYKELFDDVENDDHTTIRSKPFMVTFEQQTNTELVIIVPKLLNEQAARKFAKEPKVSIETTSGNQVNFKQENVQDLLAKQKIQTLNQFSQAQGIQQQHSDNIQQTDENMALQMLNYWWQQANPAQRATFLKKRSR